MASRRDWFYFDEYDRENSKLRLVARMLFEFSRPTHAPHLLQQGEKNNSKKNESVKRSETSELKPDESLVADVVAPVVAPWRKDVLFRGWIRKSGPALRAFCSGRNESGTNTNSRSF